MTFARVALDNGLVEAVFTAGYAVLDLPASQEHALTAIARHLSVTPCTVDGLSTALPYTSIESLLKNALILLSSQSLTASTVSLTSFCASAYVITRAHRREKGRLTFFDLELPDGDSALIRIAVSGHPRGIQTQKSDIFPAFGFV